MSPLCSRNARAPKVLVRRAQSRIDQATLEEISRDGADARSGGLIRAILEQRTRASLDGALREK